MPNVSTIATTRNPDAGEDPSGGRSIATEKNDAPENVLAIDSGTAHLSEKDIRKLKGLHKEIQALTARSNGKHHREDDLVAVDSGATLSLMRSKKWLLKLQTRLRAIVRTATGEKTQTEAHGPLGIATKNREGKHVLLGDIGEAHFLRDLTFSLLSVSQMCDHGCTVTFQPKGAQILTPDNEIIKLNRQRGL